MASSNILGGSKTPTAQQPGQQWASFVPWAGAFAVLAIVLMAGSESEQYGDVAVTMAWVVALGAFFYWYDAADISLASLIGQPAVLAK